MGLMSVASHKMHSRYLPLLPTADTVQYLRALCGMQPFRGIIDLILICVPMTVGVCDTVGLDRALVGCGSRRQKCEWMCN